ncbi:DUF4149 domain-containing protein [Noviherbaspirillum cavernae]|uniref:DUF4149 domain-containing protein n=1 Tax=Noviherbaspirillum cavernae TaxID=2320862 RepID=A0A418WZK8_9BURK|nr:DUF4149 domain-containing protein [Noviherbaspirillum cavernae]RJG05680.1 DUF4149 domain-containing protein [Noviherbaspirillum cavernae]
MFWARTRLLIVTLWVGSLWTVGYLVAPTLFSTLPDRVLAGSIAGSLFRIEAWLSVACTVILLISVRWGGSNPNFTPTKPWIGLVLGMLACTLVGYFALQPFMAALREAAGPGGVMSSDARMQFGILHGISSGIYLMQSLLGVALVLKSK